MGSTPSFGQWLKQRRKALDLTQEALAGKVGCTVVTIQKIEADSRRPSRLLAEHLAQSLNIPEAEHSEFVKFARGMPLLASSIGENPPPSNNLIALPLPLIGRSKEIEWIGQHLRSADARLLTLAGPGGIGKTRLALEVARQFPNVKFIPLQQLASSDFIVSTIASAISFQFYSGGDPKQQLLTICARNRGCWCWIISSICLMA